MPFFAPPRLNKLLALTALLFSGCALMAAPTTAMTLNEAVAEALAEHPRIGAALAEREAARQGVRQERAGYFPTLTFTGNAGGVRRQDTTTRRLAEAAGAGGENASPFAKDFSEDYRVALNQPVFDFFGTQNRVRASRERLDASEFTVIDSQETIALQAADAFLAVYAARRFLESARAFVGEIEDYRGDVTQQAAEGAADQTAMARADSLLALATAGLVEAEGQLAFAEADWRQAIGGRPPETLVPPALPQPALLPTTVEEARAQAEETSPTVLSAANAAEAARYDTKAVRSQLFPRIDAEVSYFRDEESAALGGESISAEALLRLSWAFSLGGGDLARVSRAVAQHERARFDLRERQRLVEQQVARDFTELETARRSLEQVRRQRDASETILSLTNDLFEGGEAGVLDLMAVTNETYQSRFALIEGERRAQLAVYRLLATLGELRAALAIEARAAP